jgi:molybdopterin-guanine dinucleotide biosynthesis protein A
MRGLVLAGGRSVRFGEDKALALYNGKRLIDRAKDLLEDVGLKPVVVTRREVDYSFLRCPVLRDRIPEKGPLGGIYTAMSAFKCTSFLVVTCDMPALTPSILSGLLKNHESRFLITAYSTTDGMIQPFPAIYEPGLSGILFEKLEREELSMRALIKKIPGKRVLRWQGEQAPFININSRVALSALIAATHDS